MEGLMMHGRADRLFFLFVFCLLLFSLRASAQKAPAEPPIHVPLSGSINALYYAVPTPFTQSKPNVILVNVNGAKENTSEDYACAERALTHLQQYLNMYVGFNAAKAGVDVGLKVSTGVAKMMPLSGGASLAIDLFSFALKGSMTESPDELSEMVQKEAISKLGSKIGDKIDDEAIKKALNDGVDSLVNQLYKKLDNANIDQDFKNDCNGHLNIHFVKVGLNKFKMVFKATGDCQCNNKEKPLGPWEVSGEMNADVTGITQRSKIAQSIRDVEYDMTLKWGTPTFYVTSYCDCKLPISYRGLGPNYQGAENASYQAYVGGSIISEDSDPRFNTYRLDAQFTDFLNPMAGLTADLGLNFGSQGIVDYRKFTLMVGPTLVLLQQAALNTQINCYAHLLLGISSINASVGTYSATNTTFAGEAGAGLNIAISKGLWIRPIELNYQFATPSGGISSNIKYTVGLVATIPFMK